MINKRRFFKMTKLINTANFNEETDTGLVLVDFFASWCGFCAMQAPILDRLSEKVNPDELKIVKVNVEESPEIAKKFGIMSIPALIFKKNGKLVKQIAGVHSEEQIMQIVAEINADKVSE